VRCAECGEREFSAATETLDYSGTLPGVSLLGVEVETCRGCGETYTRIPALSSLHRALARLVVQKEARLAAPEIRFLRKWLSLTGVDLAGVIGVAPETVSRWENGREALCVSADRLLRAVVLDGLSIRPSLRRLLPATAQPAGDEFTATLRPRDGRWRVEKATGVIDAKFLRARDGDCRSQRARLRRVVQ